MRTSGDRKDLCRGILKGRGVVRSRRDDRWWEQMTSQKIEGAKFKINALESKNTNIVQELQELQAART